MCGTLHVFNYSHSKNKGRFTESGRRDTVAADRPNRSSFDHTDPDATAAAAAAVVVAARSLAGLTQYCYSSPVRGPSTVGGVACFGRSFASNTHATVSSSPHSDCVVDAVDGPAVTDEEADYSTEDFDSATGTVALADDTIDSFANQYWYYAPACSTCPSAGLDEADQVCPASPVVYSSSSSD